MSRPTVMSWLDIFQITHVTHLLRPYAGGGRREIVAQPKLYAFDTGFVCHARGSDSLREEDCGTLWEHLVLDTLLSVPVDRIGFWRDKQQREVDFVIPRSREAVDTVECKWNPANLSLAGLTAFRAAYPTGRNVVVSPAVPAAYRRRVDGLEVSVIPIGSLWELFAAPAEEKTV